MCIFYTVFPQVVGVSIKSHASTRSGMGKNGFVRSSSNPFYSNHFGFSAPFYSAFRQAVYGIFGVFCGCGNRRVYLALSNAHVSSTSVVKIWSVTDRVENRYITHYSLIKRSYYEISCFTYCSSYGITPFLH